MREVLNDDTLSMLLSVPNSRLSDIQIVTFVSRGFSSVRVRKSMVSRPGTTHIHSKKIYIRTPARPSGDG